MIRMARFTTKTEAGDERIIMQTLTGSNLLASHSEGSTDLGQLSAIGISAVRHGLAHSD